MTNHQVYERLVISKDLAYAMQDALVFISIYLRLSSDTIRLKVKRTMSELPPRIMEMDGT